MIQVVKIYKTKEKIRMDKKILFLTSKQMLFVKFLVKKLKGLGMKVVSKSMKCASSMKRNYKP